ncbi:2-polyprenylphenol 6-hydroxylase [Candidatus Pelagibacter sp.]|nr:2-polyprenylphenol 6-hydroxylase [Candidatus Pelagibacter sp.]
MIKKLFILFKIARKLALSDALKVISKFHKPPFIIKIFLNLFSISFSKSNYQSNNLTDEEKLCTSIQEMGTTFIKLGQFLSTRPDIISENLSTQLERLQDRLPPFSTHEAKEIIKKNLGNKIFDTIINFGEPIAAASIAQVHKAQINDHGTIKDVAIKILRPNIKKTFNDEIDALMLLAYIVESLIAKTKRLRLVEVVFLLKEITNHEMDLRFEAAAANEFSENTKNDAGFYVPKIYWSFTSEEILTLDWIEGISIREKEILKSKKINIENIATDIIQHFLRHAVRDGFFHADMHQGNIFIDDSGQIIPIDFGIMGRMDKLNRRYLAEILYGFVQRDYKKVAEVHIVAGLVPNNVQVDELAQALRSIGEPIFGQSVKDISGGKLLKQLFDVTEKFNMQTQPQLLLLQKTMVVVEGVARKLNPNTNIWATSKPVLEKWLKETKDPINNLTDTLKDTAEVIKKLPELPKIMDKANQALTFMASGKIPQESHSFSALNEKKIEMKSFRNQSIIGLLLLVFLGVIVL